MVKNKQVLDKWDDSDTEESQSIDSGSSDNVSDKDSNEAVLHSSNEGSRSVSSKSNLDLSKKVKKN